MHLFTAAAPKVPVQWRSATGSAAPGRRSPPLGHATHGRALEPTGIREELVQSRLGSGSTDMGFAGQLEERRGKRSLRSHGNDTAPSLNPCVLRSGAERGRRTRRPHAREHAEEGCGFCRPAPAHLDAEHDEAAAASPAELRVRLSALAAGCIAESNAGHNVSTGPWSSVTCKGLTKVASTATCEPCQSGSPLQTTSMRRASWTGTWRFMAASLTFRPTRAPASWQTRAMARSRGKAREARTPDVAQAARWSP